MSASYADCVRDARQMVDRDFLRTLGEPRPLVVAWATLLLWAQIILSWTLALSGPLWILPLCFLVNCAVIQAMLLWTHEASHVSLIKDRKLNDLWCDVLFAGPVGMSVAAYRAKHMTHHAHLGTAEDQDNYPYMFNVKGTRNLLAFLGRTLTGITGFSVAFNKYARGAVSEERSDGAALRWPAPVMTVAFNLGLLALCILADRWYLYFLLWAYPIIAVAIFLNVVRTIAEHQPDDYPVYQNGTEVSMRPLARTTVPNIFEKWLIYQANFNYHFEHHVFPNIPHHNLKRVHQKLVEGGFYEKHPDCLQRSGFKRFWHVAQNRVHNDFSDPVTDAVSLS